VEPGIEADPLLEVGESMSKTSIILHHSGTWDDQKKKDYDAIKAGHLGRGYRDIGYHWLIEYVDGQIQVLKGREEAESAAACPGKNYTAIHVCLVGNFEETIPTDEQYRAVADLCRDIMTRWSITEITGHRDHYATACPGKNFDVGKVRELLKEVKDMPEGAKEALINVNGKEFPAYITGGHVYFGQGVSVREFMAAVNRTLVWDSKNLTLNIK
jgi:hypothetical protein